MLRDMVEVEAGGEARKGRGSEGKIRVAVFHKQFEARTMSPLHGVIWV